MFSSLNEYDVKYGLNEKLRIILLKQAVFEGNKVFNFKKFFNGIEIKDMNDNVLDNELSSMIFSNKSIMVIRIIFGERRKRWCFK